MKRTDRNWNMLVEKSEAERTGNGDMGVERWDSSFISTFDYPWRRQAMWTKKKLGTACVRLKQLDELSPDDRLFKTNIAVSWVKILKSYNGAYHSCIQVLENQTFQLANEKELGTLVCQPPLGRVVAKSWGPSAGRTRGGHSVWLLRMG